MGNLSIDQGTIIYGIRSSKYPSVRCYGIIITARCDIAQRKVPKYYFLVAVDASDWFCTEHGYDLAYSSIIKNIKNDVDVKAAELDLNGDVLVSIENENLETILTNKREEFSENKSCLKKVNSLCEKITEYHTFCGKSMSDLQRGIAIKTRPKVAIAELEEIYTGKQIHYYYLPQHAYLNNSVYSKGIIVDLLEIGELSLEDADRIESPGIDYQIVPKIPTSEEMLEALNSGRHQELEEIFSNIQEAKRLTTTYWLNGESDFVGFEGTIMSPWCEHLMQRFSNAFIRIGIIDPTKKDYETVIESCYREVAE